MRPFVKFLLSALFFAAAIGLIAWVTRKEPPPQDGPLATWSENASNRFRVRYKTPRHWISASPQEPDAQSGWNGFVQISGIGGAAVGLEDALQLEVETGVNPYGSKAQVKRLTAGGQPALMVLPSDDQPRTDGRSVLIVQYPGTIKFRDESYQHLILWADRAHIEDIASTLSFITSEEAVLGTLEGKVTITSKLPDVFKNRRVLVLAEDGKTLVKEVTIDASGTYKVALDPGAYVIDINHLGLDKTPTLPKKITIEPGKTVKLDIAIDTGVR